ncbi:histidine phosphatase family protein [Niveispirillum sp. KHB5.9]|uniref:histidine phosphatase family protein n=1 Tax=Niveispirillum sp. KHB5.9 TaxID=3400269 RepID=UPI003A87E947
MDMMLERRIIAGHPILLVRHGQTHWNVEARCQGQMDSDLTDLGRAQADQVGRILLRLVDAIPGWRDAVRLVSSPLGRTQETTRIINRHLDLPVSLDARLAEVSFGDWEGMTRREVEAANPWLAAHGPYGWQFHAPNGERYEGVQERLLGFVADVDRPTIAISHGMSGRILRAYYAAQDQETACCLPVPQDKVFRLSADGVEELA